MEYLPKVIEWIATILAMLGAYLNLKKNKWCFVIYSIANMFWIAVGLMKGLYGLVVVQIVFTGFAVWGFIEWSPGLKEKIVNRFKK